MQTKQRDIFTTIHTEGSILPADLLHITAIMCGSCLGVRLGGECPMEIRLLWTSTAPQVIM